MNNGTHVLKQLFDAFTRFEFNRCVDRYQGNRRVRSFSCWSQYVTMAFAQLTARDSLRDIESSLRSFDNHLYHVGIQGSISRSTLADANDRRSYRIWEDLGMLILARARRSYADDPVAGRLKATVYALDATIIDLCLNLFPWAGFRRYKGAVKVHTLLDLRGNIPCFTVISEGSVHEVNVLDQLRVEPGSYYIMDRGYVDYQRLHELDQDKGFFVIRAKSNMQYRVLESREVNRNRGLRSDQTIMLKSQLSQDKYPACLRRVSLRDPETGKLLVFLTNDFRLAAATICKLYHARWQVELFFKWIKQYLRIKTFYGNSINAVKTQIWIAMTVYGLVAIKKRELHLEQSMGEIMQILSLKLFEKIPINQLFCKNQHRQYDVNDHKSLSLFDF